MFVRTVWLVSFLSLSWLTGCEDPVDGVYAADMEHLARGEQQEGEKKDDDDKKDDDTEHGDTESTEGPTPYPLDEPGEGGVYPPDIIDLLQSHPFIHILECGGEKTEEVDLQTDETHEATVVHCGPVDNFFADMSAIKAEAIDLATQECVDQMRGNTDGDDVTEDHAFFCEDAGQCDPGYCKGERVNGPNNDTESSSSGIGYRPTPGANQISWWPATVPHTSDYGCYRITVKCSGGFSTSFSCPCC